MDSSEGNPAENTGTPGEGALRVPPFREDRTPAVSEHVLKAHSLLCCSNTWPDLHSPLWAGSSRPPGVDFWSMAVGKPEATAVEEPQVQILTPRTTKPNRTCHLCGIPPKAQITSV